jgi:CrcB protein
LEFVLVGIGGAAGAVTRYAVDRAVTSAAGGTAGWGTLVVNLTGSFAVGLLVALASERGAIPEALRLPLGIGFLGAYTTFSTWMLEAFRTAELGDLPWAVTNIVGSVVLGLIAVGAGLAIGRNVG